MISMKITTLLPRYRQLLTQPPLSQHVCPSPVIPRVQCMLTLVIYICQYCIHFRHNRALYVKELQEQGRNLRKRGMGISNLSPALQHCGITDPALVASERRNFQTKLGLVSAKISLTYHNQRHWCKTDRSTPS